MGNKITVQQFLLENYPEETEIREYLLSKFRPLQCKKNDIIVRQGEVCKKTFFLEEGVVMHRYAEGKLEKATAFNFEGDFLTSWESFNTEEPSEYYLQCLEDCQIQYLSKETYEGIPQVNTDINLIRLSYTTEMYLKQYKLTSRLITYPTEKMYEYIIQEYPNIIQRVPLKYIAEFMGISNEHLSRLRKKIAKKA